MRKATPKATVKIPTRTNSTDLNTAYRKFNTAKYWAVSKGATFKQLFPIDFEAYKGYVEGDVEIILDCAGKLESEYGMPAFQAGERNKARDKFYHISRPKGKTTR